MNFITREIACFQSGFVICLVHHLSHCRLYFHLSFFDHVSLFSKSGFFKTDFANFEPYWRKVPENDISLPNSKTEPEHQNSELDSLIQVS